MVRIVSVLLSSIASLTVVSAARASDLPVKAKGVEYVKVCSLYGAGFYYVPGTDTCIKIGGAIRLDLSINSNGYEVPYWSGGAGGQDLWTKDYFATRERVNATTDTRTATEWGVLRTYANMQFDFFQNRESIAGGVVEVDYAFIQFAGFTFGKAVSQFDPQWALSKPIISSGVQAGSNNLSGIPQLAYTASFENGISTTFGFENASPYRNAGLYNTNTYIVGPASSSFTGTFYGSNSNTFLGNAAAGDHIPDVVANVRVDRAWGTLHVAAAMHSANPNFYGSTETSGHPDASYGFAFNGAAEFKNLPTGNGDTLKISATYAEGAAKYVWGGTIDTIGAGRYAKFDGNSLAFGYVLDGVFNNGGQIQKSKSWEVSAFYEHYWNTAWRTSLFGSYTAISYGAAGNALLAAAFGGTSAGFGTSSTALPAGTSAGFLVPGTTGSFDFAVAQVGTRTAWTPVRNLTLSASVMFSRLDQNLTGAYTQTAGAAKANGTYVLRDQNLFNGTMQILRSF
ncbi:Porin subfamily protein [Tardiphaga sp. OK246]|uniref:porin n=1 Tax=Tardiphaga sp. OK246 TaxID=1855307 RepID=UPI000B72DB81|nr:porin [Tardiphaga sp. OK246]SNT32573.1 Porin subfamily protein [Tardiphaga sp. OK246]